MAEEPEAKGTEEESPPEKKSKLMLFAALGLGVLILGGGGFFAYTKFLAPEPTEDGAQVEDKKPKQAIGQIFPLSPFVVNLADLKGKRYLKIRMEMELESTDAMEKAELIKPKLRDMVIMMLTSLSFEEVMTPEGKIRIRDELVDRFNQVMKPDRVTQIYFTEFVVQ